MVKPPSSRKTSNKNPSILSHEFVIQNHADIVSCIAMVFVVGLMVQATTPLASVFITMQHNVTEIGAEVNLYSSGIKDVAAVFFYSLICIVIHAIIQEYILDKVTKRLHLSKSKLAIFTNSGQLAIFYLISVFWGYDILIKEHIIPDFSLLWSSYPPPMTFIMKLYLIIQLAYSLHELPELYFQREKKEEWLNKALASLITLVLIAVPYYLHFNRLLVCLVVLHHTSEMVEHVGGLVGTVDKEERFNRLSRMISFGVMVCCRVTSIMLAVLTLWFGLAKTAVDQPHHLNNTIVRLGLLGTILAAQMYLISSVIAREVARARDAKVAVTHTTSKGNKGPKNKDEKKSKKPKKSEESDLPEVDQNTNKNLKHRSQKAK